MNMNMIMKKAQEMQKNMNKTKEEVEKQTFNSKQQLVEVEVNGNKEVTKISINKDVTSDDIEMLEDMILIAVNDALSKANSEMEKRLGSISQGLSGLI